jgi:hypothetical protein
MVIGEAWRMHEVEGQMWFSVVMHWSLSLVDESEEVQGDVDGDGGAGQVSGWLQHGVDRVSSVVGSPESSKCRLKLRVRSRVRVEG